MAGSSPQDDAQPGSSPATEIPESGAPQGDAAPKGSQETLLDRVEGVLNTGKSATPESGQGTEPDGKAPEAEGSPKGEKADGEGDEPLGPVTDDELSKYHSRTRKRIKGLIENVETARREVDELKPDAEIGRNIKAFADQHSLTAEDVNAAMTITALVRNDPFKAVEALVPIVQELQRMTGMVVPQDLQERVRLGQLTEDAALELAQTRARSQHVEQKAQLQEQQSRQLVERTTVQTLAASVGDAVSAWDRQWKASDPDYGLKQKRVQELVELDLYKNGAPTSPDEAVKRAQAIRDFVDKEMKAFVPAPRAVAPQSGAASSSAAPKPKTLEEALSRVLSAG
jgi:hypothetical protein